MTIHRGSTVFVVLVLSRWHQKHSVTMILPIYRMDYRSATGPIASSGVGVLLKTLINLASLGLVLTTRWREHRRTGLMNAAILIGTVVFSSWLTRSCLPSVELLCCSVHSFHSPEVVSLSILFKVTGIDLTCLKPVYNYYFPVGHKCDYRVNFVFVKCPRPINNYSFTTHL